MISYICKVILNFVIMARKKFKLSLRVYMNVNRTIIRNCCAILYHVSGIPILNMELYLDSETSSILNKLCMRFCDLVMNEVYFIDVDTFSMTMRYSCDGLLSTNVYYGDLISHTSSKCSLALLLKTFGKNLDIV